MALTTRTRPATMDSTLKPHIVEVGPDHIKYTVRKSSLAHYSKYFQMAFDKLWKDAEDKVITLEDVEAGISSIFID
ncbi:hypothetical protein CC78DRAFT_582788 [Lojkania enalia]|uniref:BTB domain-containing protein n=1 Tax=Lojkania enalia TaxID=147567 RepID=A0A9P4N4R6_9PLEO|nr:hypothetical protein CC78DRAFT_582788 [Didymosphaeria enalia]